MTELTRENFDEIVSHGGSLVVEFYSPSCTYCKKTEAGIKELEEDNSVTAEFARCSAAEEEQLSERFDVTALPTLLFFKDGELKNKLSGYTHKLVIADALSRLG
ncbi:MAG: thioredoxin family protein [Huintestinicola sp.]|uniref:thioredoxin family protein n=1 Tax=Huintestinicola sp. TaxID=2981661 RepID=UPI003F039AA8